MSNRGLHRAPTRVPVDLAGVVGELAELKVVASILFTLSVQLSERGAAASMSYLAQRVGEHAEKGLREIEQAAAARAKLGG